MTRTQFQHAIALIDDDLISKAAIAVKDIKTSSIINLKKISMIAACISLILYLSPNILEFFKANAEDPNWHKFHTYAYSVDEAVEKFGDDLLLDRLVLKNDYPKPYVEFILEHEEGGVNDRVAWETIDADVNYGGGRFSVKEDHVNLRIFFKEDDTDIDGTDRYPGYRHIFSEGFLTTEINGVTVKYKEHSGKKFAYKMRAEFEHNGYIYFLDTFSKENKELFWDTIKQMLDS